MENYKSLINKVYNIARKKGEFEAKFGKDFYFRVCYDKDFDKNKQSLYSYIDFKKGCYYMARRTKKELKEILKYNGITEKKLNLVLSKVI